MSFSSMVFAWPFLLGPEAGTVPLGSAARNKVASAVGNSLRRRAFINSFLPFAEDIKVENMIINKAMNTRDFRAIVWGKYMARKWGEEDFLISLFSERESDQWGVIWGVQEKYIHNGEREREREILGLKLVGPSQIELFSFFLFWSNWTYISIYIWTSIYNILFDFMFFFKFQCYFNRIFCWYIVRSWRVIQHFETNFTDVLG